MRRTLVLLAAVPALLIACGDDDDGDDAGGATTAAASATTAAGDATTATGGTGPGGSEYCDALTDYKATSEEFAPVMASGTATPEQLEEAITAQKTSLTALLDAAPGDIQGDMNAIAGPTFAFIEALEEVGYDLTALEDNAAAAEALNQLDSPDYIEATESVDAYGLENCGISIGE